MSQSEPASVPRLSVVVALISGRPEHLETCLTALTQQADPPAMEIVVPCDKRVGDVSRFRARFPVVHFIPSSGKSAGGNSDWSREHHDELRAQGLQHARGEIVALTEDHCKVGERWCATIDKEHAAAHAVIGGAVENGTNRLLNWAVYFCDFGRYQNPVLRGPAEFLSDCNIAYKRKALEATADLWKDAYHEESVNWALRKLGHSFWQCPEMVVWQQREKMSLTAALRERYVWGRSYAGTRVAESEPEKRLFYAAFSFLLPALLLARMGANVLRKRRHVVKFILAAPLAALLTVGWSVGEFIGYVTGRPH